MENFNKIINPTPTKENRFSGYIRPGLTFLWTLAIIYSVVTGRQLGEWEKTVYVSIVTYYFAERAALKRPGEAN